MVQIELADQVGAISFYTDERGWQIQFHQFTFNREAIMTISIVSAQSFLTYNGTVVADRSELKMFM